METQKRKRNNADREDEPTISRQELLEKKLIEALYESNIDSPESDASFLSILDMGFGEKKRATTEHNNYNIQDYINFIVDQIIHTGITYKPLDKYDSAIYLLVKLIMAISIKLKIPLNQILGMIVFGQGHGGERIISPEDNAQLNASVNFLEYVPVVAEKTLGYDFTLNVARELMERYFERKGKPLSRTSKKCYRDYCAYQYSENIQRNEMNKNTIEVINKYLVGLNARTDIGPEEKNKKLKSICDNPLTIMFCEKDFSVTGKNIYVETDDFDTNYARFIQQYEYIKNYYNKQIEKDKLSIDTSKMMRVSKSTSNKERVCEKIQLLSNNQGNLYINIFVLFYVLPEFSTEHSTYALIIDLMLNRIMTECRARRKPVVPRDKDIDPVTMVNQLLQDDTELFYEFGILENQRASEINSSGFSFSFLSYLDHMVSEMRGQPEKIDIKNMFQRFSSSPIWYLNPARFMTMIGEIVPQIKTTYINNSCRPNIIDNPDVIESSSAETTPNASPSAQPRTASSTELNTLPSAQPRTASSAQLSSSTLGGSKRRNFSRSTRHKRHKRTTKKYRQYSIGNGRRTKY